MWSDANTNMGDLQKCTINSLSEELNVCTTTGCPNLKYIEDGGTNRRLYGNGGDFDGGTDSIFTRWVTIERIPNQTAADWEVGVYRNRMQDFGECADPNNLEIKVTAHLEWQEGLRARQFVLSENLMWWGRKFTTNCS